MKTLLIVVLVLMIIALSPVGQWHTQTVFMHPIEALETLWKWVTLQL